MLMQKAVLTKQHSNGLVVGRPVVQLTYDMPDH